MDNVILFNLIIIFIGLAILLLVILRFYLWFRCMVSRLAHDRVN